MEKCKTLREALKINNIKIADVSRKTNIPATTLYSLADKPLENLKVDMIDKISAALKINLYEYTSDDYIFKKSGILETLEHATLEQGNAHTIAAHFEDDEYTEEELKKITEFAEFVKNQRKK